MHTNEKNVFFYSGMFCETEANECIPNPCLNGGTCIDELNNFECLCQPGFSGTNCQIETTQCKIMDYHSNCILWDKKDDKLFVLKLHCQFNESRQIDIEMSMNQFAICYVHNHKFGPLIRSS